MAIEMGRPAVFLFWIIFLWSRSVLLLGAESAILVSFEGTSLSGIYIYEGDSASVTKTSPYNFTSFGSSNVQIRSMDVNVANGSIYFFERISRCIYRLHSGNVQNVHCGISSSLFTSIAYDWVSGNMYWTDGFFNWIAVQPAGATDKSMFRVIIQDDIENPSALAVDAVAGYAFWFDISQSGYRIERSLLDGTFRTPIITTSLLNVNDIEIDVAERRLYWTDEWRYSIETSLYDGTDRKVLYKQLNAKFRSITVDTNHVCATLYDEQWWNCYSKSTGSFHFYRSSEFDLTDLVIITMYKEDLKPPVTNGCSTLGCEHFCVNLRPNGKCMCKEGYTLDTDGLHCTENHPLYSKAFVMSNSTNICMLSFRAVTGYNDPLRCVGNVVQGCQLLTVDTSNKLIYYVDTTSNFIREYNTATDTSRQITTAYAVSGMVFDWTDGNLYWSESTTGKVKYVTIATLAAKELVDASSPPSHLTIDPHTRTLFWVEGTSGYEMKIVSMSLASNGKSVILTQPSPAYIKDIFFDVSSDRLYFVQYSTLTSIQRNGSGIDYVYRNLPLGVDKLIIYKRYAIWSITISSNLNSLSVQAKSPQTINLTNSIGVITGLTVYDNSLQRQTKGPCSHLNGGCEQLCMTGVSGTAVCACSYGLHLQPDEKSCTSVPQSSNFLLVIDFVHGKLFQISTTDAQITALDINAVERPIDAMLDPETSFVFWSEINDGTIRKSTLNGSDSETIYKPTGFDSYVDALVMDHSSGILYYAVSGEAGTNSPGNVGVFKPTTGLAKTLVESLNNIEDLDLYPSKGLMFFTHQDQDNTFVNIVRASMNGMSSNVIIALDSNDFLTNLAIDYTTDRLYWSSLYGDVEWSSLSGSGRTKFNTPFKRIRSIDIAGDFIYLTSERKQKVVKMNIQSETEVEFMADNADLGFLLNVHVYPGQAQPVTRCPSAISNGRLKDPCTRNAADVCTFQCDSGYTSTVASDTLTCGQDGQWNQNIQLICQVESTTAATTKDNDQQTMVYVGAGLAGLVILSVTIVTIVCVVVKRRRRLSSLTGRRSEPNVYYTPNQQASHQQEILASGLSDQCIDNIAYSSQVKRASCHTMALPTPPYSVKPDPTYDSIPANQNYYSDPVPPYESSTPPIQHGPSVRSDTLTTSVKSEESEYITLVP
ncbi:low-density lipoprotein receptor-related protein 5-like isoform X2 [Pecten maximus]|uniref:low-density lipoprotein receptor-related protein 5-like isoform X2 n=1 Tax=Pecten maximus TaxID=6579 RepID=UPI001458A4A5|nr:low-density lipoprotein receptor-related protein 5-like isoform X2 [Pecten maximus]